MNWADDWANEEAMMAPDPSPEFEEVDRLLDRAEEAEAVYRHTPRWRFLRRRRGFFIWMGLVARAQDAEQRRIEAAR